MNETTKNKIEEILKENKQYKLDLDFFKAALLFEKNPSEEGLKTLLGFLYEIAKKESKEDQGVVVKNPIREVTVSNMIEKIMVSNFPDSFEVSNLKDVKFPKFPTEMKVRNPRFAETVKEIGLLRASFKKLHEHIVEQDGEGVLIRNRDQSEAIPVVLTTADRKSFYTAMFQALGAVSGSTTDRLKEILAEVIAHGTNGSGRLAVTTAATAEALTTTTACRKVWISCLSDNTSSLVVVGDSAVVALEASRQGITIFKNNTFGPFYIDDLSKMFVDVLTNGDGVSYYYEV